MVDKKILQVGYDAYPVFDENMTRLQPWFDLMVDKKGDKKIMVWTDSSVDGNQFIGGYTDSSFTDGNGQVVTIPNDDTKFKGQYPMVQHNNVQPSKGVGALSSMLVGVEKAACFASKSDPKYKHPSCASANYPNLHAESFYKHGKLDVLLSELPAKIRGDPTGPGTWLRGNDLGTGIANADFWKDDTEGIVLGYSDKNHAQIRPVFNALTKYWRKNRKTILQPYIKKLTKEILAQGKVDVPDDIDILTKKCLWYFLFQGLMRNAEESCRYVRQEHTPSLAIRQFFVPPPAPVFMPTPFETVFVSSFRRPP